MEQYTELLRSYRLFSGLDPEQIAKIISLAKSTSYQPQQFIIKEGDIAHNIFIIIEGEVEVIKNDIDNQNQYLLAHLNKGAIIGEMSLLSDLPRAATVRALKPTTTLEIPIDDLRALAVDNAVNKKFIYYKIVENIAKENSARLRNMDQALANLLHKEKVNEKIANSKVSFFMECWRF